MKKKELEAFAREAAKSIKTEKDLNFLSQMLTKIMVEVAEVYALKASESLNSIPRKATKKRTFFPTDDSAKKVIYLATQDASKEWTMPIRNWKPTLNPFMIEFDERLVGYI